MTTENIAPYNVRWMIRRDMHEVLVIESSRFEHAWTEEDFVRCLRQRNACGMVAEHGDKVVGFMVYELRKSKLYILNFAAHPNWRRTGVGRRLVDKLAWKLSGHRRTRITLHVRESNLVAQKFFRACGFEALRVERGFYEDCEEDAYYFCKRFTAAKEGTGI